MNDTRINYPKINIINCIITRYYSVNMFIHTNILVVQSCKVFQ